MTNSLFSAPTWFWITLFLLALIVPILIHLIHLWRYQRVRWAAMEFLAKSIRKRRRQVWLKQTILIASRMSLLVLAIIVFGQFQCRSERDYTIASGSTCLIIVDDSFSMGQITRQAISGPVTSTNQPQSEQTCFDNARQTALALVRRFSRNPGQKVVLLKTSMPADSQPLEPMRCDSEIEFQVNRYFDSGFSHSSISPNDWLHENANKLPDCDHMYILSDFRLKDFAKPKLSTEEGKAFPKTSTWIRCAAPSTKSVNLSLVRLQPDNSLIAAGVPFYLTLEVKNHSPEAVENIEVQFRKSSGLENPNFELDESSVLIPRIDAGSEETVQVPLLFYQSGDFLIEAELPWDDLATDNLLQIAIEVDVANRVLLIAEDGNESARYLGWLFQPRSQGSQVINTGFQAERMSAKEFSQQGFPIDDYQIVFLLSDDLVNPALAESLEQFTAQGGLLFIVPGPFANMQVINANLYRDGKGVLPCPIANVVDLPARTNSNDGDLNFVDEKFGLLFGNNAKSLLANVNIEQKFIPPRDWIANTDLQTRVLATVRGRSTTPLIIKSSFKRGSVITLLSPFETGWNNWPKNPTFVVLIYQLIYQFSEGNQWQPMLVDNQDLDSTFLNSIDADSAFQVRMAEDVRSWPTAETKTIDRLANWVPDRRGIYRLGQGTNSVWIPARLDYRESALNIATNDDLERQIGLPSNAVIVWSQVSSIKPPAINSQNLVGWLLILSVFAFELWFSFQLGFHSPTNKVTGITTPKGGGVS